MLRANIEEVGSKASIVIKTSLLVFLQHSQWVASHIAEDSNTYNNVVVTK